MGSMLHLYIKRNTARYQTSDISITIAELHTAGKAAIYNMYMMIPALQPIYSLTHAAEEAREALHDGERRGANVLKRRKIKVIICNRTDKEQKEKYIFVTGKRVRKQWK